VGAAGYLLPFATVEFWTFSSLLRQCLSRSMAVRSGILIKAIKSIPFKRLLSLD
jgi:hypothetical protein